MPFKDFFGGKEHLRRSFSQHPAAMCLISTANCE